MKRSAVAAAVTSLLVVLVLASVTSCGNGRGAEQSDTRSADTPATTERPPASTAPPSTTTVVTSTAAVSTTARAPSSPPVTAHATTAPRGGAPATEPRGSGPLTGKVITLDPGHNGGTAGRSAEINRLVFIGNGMKPCMTTGTSTNDGYPEHAFAWDTSVRLRTVLEARGATVVMTRPDNRGWGPCHVDRARIGNEARSDVSISIHADGAPPSGRGFHVITPLPVPGYNDGIVEPSARFADILRDAMVAQAGIPVSNYLGRNGIDPRSDLGGLNMSTVPKVFLETGNMRNATDAALLKDPAFRQRIAEVVADAMQRYLGG